MCLTSLCLVITGLRSKVIIVKGKFIPVEILVSLNVVGISGREIEYVTIFPFSRPLRYGTDDERMELARCRNAECIHSLGIVFYTSAHRGLMVEDTRSQN